MIFKNSKISSVVLIGLLFGIFFPILITFILFSNKYKERSAQTINIISYSISVSATEALWFFSQDWIDVVIESAVLNEKVYSATLYNHKNEELAFKYKKTPLLSGKRVEIPLVKDAESIGRLVLVFNMDEINRDIYIEKENLLVILFFQAVISSVILFLIIKYKVLDPIKLLVKQSKLLSNGELEERFIWEQKDEFGKLGNEIDKTRLSLKDMFFRLEEKVVYDSLTKVYNRHGFEKVFYKEIKRCQRYKRALSIIMFDIDFFKKVNDKHGHLVGDEVLIRICEVVQEQIRDSDSLIRWGGEEFIVITPETNLEQSIILAEKLRDVVEKTDFKKVGSITISLAVAQKEDEESNEKFLKRVDDLLYYSKNEGRNRVSF